MSAKRGGFSRSIARCLQPLQHHAARCATQVDDLRGTPLSVGTLEEIIDEK